MRATAIKKHDHRIATKAPCQRESARFSCLSMTMATKRNAKTVPESGWCPNRRVQAAFNAPTTRTISASPTAIGDIRFAPGCAASMYF